MGWFKRSEHPEEQLSAYLDGELDARQAENVARHLADCARCVELLEELRGTKAMLSALPRQAPGRSFVLGAEHARERPAPPARRSTFSFAPAVAASLLVALFVVDVADFSSTANDSGGGAAEKTTASRQAEDAPVPAQAPAQDNAGSAGSRADVQGTPQSGAGSGAPPVVPNTAPQPESTLSTFSTGSAESATPDEDAFSDASSQAASEDDGSGVSTLRVLQVLAAGGLLASVFLVYVRPRVFERK